MILVSYGKVWFKIVSCLSFFLYNCIWKLSCKISGSGECIICHLTVIYKYMKSTKFLRSCMFGYNWYDTCPLYSLIQSTINVDGEQSWALRHIGGTMRAYYELKNHPFLFLYARVGPNFSLNIYIIPGVQLVSEVYALDEKCSRSGLPSAGSRSLFCCFGLLLLVSIWDHISSVLLSYILWSNWYIFCSVV